MPYDENQDWWIDSLNLEKSVPLSIDLLFPNSLKVTIGSNGAPLPGWKERHKLKQEDTIVTKPN